MNFLCGYPKPVISHFMDILQVGKLLILCSAESNFKKALQILLYKQQLQTQVHITKMKLIIRIYSLSNA